MEHENDIAIRRFLSRRRPDGETELIVIRDQPEPLVSFALPSERRPEMDGTEFYGWR